MQKMNLEKKPYNILNFVFVVTLSLFLLSLAIYFTILRTYLATFIKKKYSLKKFCKLKIEANLFNNFYSKFIQLAFDFEYTL